MRSHHSLVISLASFLLLGGCSSGASGLRGTGGTRPTVTGGGAGLSSTGAGAGAQAPGGAAGSSMVANGGETRPKTDSSTGGAGAHTVAGSPSAGSKTGGSSAGVGGNSGTGGRSLAGGSSLQAGSGAGAGSTSISSAGGSRGGGTASSAGRTGTSRPLDAGVGDGGIVATGYCEGSTAKLTYQGQTITPAVTDFESNLAMGCCDGYGVNLHSTPWLGFDVAIELILSINVFSPGEFAVGGPTSMDARALVFKNSEQSTSIAQGKLRVFGADGSVGMTEFGLCLEVTDTVSELAGTKLYVPRVIIGSYQHDQRFQIFLLEDSTLRAGVVSAQPLDELVLAKLPLLHLGYIAYVEKATGKIGLNPGQKKGDWLRTTLGRPLDMPFVVVADGTRIYLGTFTSGLSSMSPTGPFVTVEDITADGFTLRSPAHGADPRNDERIVKALSERGKLVP